MKAHLYPGATDAQVDLIADKYSQDPVAVSYPARLPKTPPDRILLGFSFRYREPQRLHVKPINLPAWGLRLTSLFRSPEFKRLAAIQGDQAFHSGRRSAFAKWADTQNVWSFCSSLDV